MNSQSMKLLPKVFNILLNLATWSVAAVANVSEQSVCRLELFLF